MNEEKEKLSAEVEESTTHQDPNGIKASAEKLKGDMDKTKGLSPEDMKRAAEDNVKRDESQKESR